MRYRVSTADVVGLIRPTVDAHSLGLQAMARLLEDFGIRSVEAGREVREAALSPEVPAMGRLLRRWIDSEGITVIGFSYRLDPEEGSRLFGRLVDSLRESSALAERGGMIRALYFAGLPEACSLVRERHPFVAGLFEGEESPAETLDILGLPRSLLPVATAAGMVYDEARLAFGRQLVAKGDYLAVGPVDRGGAPRFGARGETLASRVAHGSQRGLPPLIRAHMGPYLPDRREAVELYLSWVGRVAKSGLLDVLSIGNSQLSQSAFGEDWTGRPDGGGVPLATAEEFEEVWRAARPMLVRCYAGTKDVPAMARLLEERIDTAWHALSLWWFCAIDGRGPNGVLQNLREHLSVLDYAASTGKPYEPNVPHHFAFRGGDDLSYVVSAYVAAKAAKARGVRHLVLQAMLNTPKTTWGVQDLAKARTMLKLVRGLEGPDFKVYLQPRGGLDHFSRDEAKAKAQLAASTALMDDIEPLDARSPDIIHVVGYSEGRGLADPAVVEESVRITRHALEEYRRARRRGAVPDMARDPEVDSRAAELESGARTLVAASASSIARPYSAEGLYEILASGFFALPDLAELREEFSAAVAWKTRPVAGSVKVVDAEGLPLSAEMRASVAADRARRRAAARLGQRLP